MSNSPSPKQQGRVWRASVWAPLILVSYSPGFCPRKFGRVQRRHRSLKSKKQHFITLYFFKPNLAQMFLPLTNAFIAGVQELHERSTGSLSVNDLSRLFIKSQFTQNTSCHTLDVVHWWIQQLQTEKTKYTSVSRTNPLLYQSKSPVCNLRFL